MCSRYTLAVVFGVLFHFFNLGSAFAQTPITFLPFDTDTRVRCVQANNGDYSHFGNLAYAYDFDMGSSVATEDNPIYGEFIYAPFDGVVEEVRRGVIDFQNNASANDLNNNGWGNTIVLKVRQGSKTFYFRFAHMMDGSIPSYFSRGDIVWQGDIIGQVGQTGWSASPHLHMQMSSASATGSSERFDFVEGPMNRYTYATSELERDKFVIDNDGRISLGAPFYSGSFTNSTTSVFRSWSRYAVGPNYRTSTSSGYYSRWMFTMLAGTVGTYDFFVNCPVISTGDTRATYRVYSSSSSLLSRTVNQRYLGSSYGLIGTANLSSGTRYTVQGTRSGNTFCADAIVIYRR